MSSPKKGSGIKKPKARSKFKPPENFGVQVSTCMYVSLGHKKNHSPASSRSTLLELL